MVMAMTGRWLVKALSRPLARLSAPGPISAMHAAGRPLRWATPVALKAAAAS
jgi:hypothetical protein